MKFKKTVKSIWYWLGVTLFLLCFKIFFRVRVFGRKNIPRGGAVLFIANHQSFFDPILCGITVSRQLHYLARNTLFDNWLMNWLLHSVNVIPVRRGEADLGAMKKVIGKLKDGYGVCLFPEATRSSDGKIRAFKPGFGLLCRRSGASVVPVVIDGAFECWPKHQKLFSIGRKISVSYGESITAGQVNEMNDRELAEKLTETLRKMQNEVRSKDGKEIFDYSIE